MGFRTGVCNCVNPHIPCNACGAGMNDGWSPWQNPPAIPLPVRQPVEVIKPVFPWITEERLREIIREELDRKGLTTD